MKQNGVTQEAAGEKLGVHRVTLSRWLAGTMEPRIEQIESLADYFGVSTDYLIRGIPNGPDSPGPLALSEEELLWISNHKDLLNALRGLPKGKVQLIANLVEALGS